ncbi:MAG: M48 family metallopeptidase [Desulfosudaceae bacterium]
MTDQSDFIDYGSKRIFFELLPARRKTLEIAVHPDKRVVVRVPLDASIEAVKTKVKKRARWIIRQLNYFEQFDPRTPPRRYVGGESHLYLGRRYRLKIRKTGQNMVKLKQGYFQVMINGDTSPDKVRRMMEQWYRAKAGTWFPAILDDHLPPFARSGAKPPRLKIRKMKTRWGSLSAKGTLTLNLDLIRAPKSCIEYVITHELCHLVHRQHDAAFYRLLEKHMPDWEKRRHKLELTLA